jgi:hypothetical protein
MHTMDDAMRDLEIQLQDLPEGLRGQLCIHFGELVRKSHEQSTQTSLFQILKAHGLVARDNATLSRLCDVFRRVVCEEAPIVRIVKQAIQICNAVSDSEAVASRTRGKTSKSQTQSPEIVASSLSQSPPDLPDHIAAKADAVHTKKHEEKTIRQKRCRSSQKSASDESPPEGIPHSLETPDDICM